ncbi:cytochrome c oxidase assembly factor CtaG [Cohnella zeiphila]|uniref:Cytochrome c oxidase assembly factor CtaG n=1 Tax=Cohnella zeiphila TaxID=2761120 RepID=A0A7X0SHK7_9BACL|nr:cytochrome c oxidase assembly factor CtaG [Cohnella zeiphila]MBB6730114.1 cytochrome c oxidase assembly factor CtaG [Cohnella zeiphila]
MKGLSYFSFSDLWSPFFLVFMLAVATLYSFLVGPWRYRFQGSEPVTIGRQIAFYLSVVLLYAVHGGPLSLMGHLMFTYHMTDMAISYILVPPILLYGIPSWMWRSLLSLPVWRPIRFLGKPLFGLFLFNLMFSFYHLPGIHDWIMVHYFIHGLFYIVLLLAALLNWWHISAPVPEWVGLTPLRRLGFIFLNSLLLTPACVLIIFASDPLFSVYNDPQVWAQAMRYCVSSSSASLLAEFNGPGFFSVLSPHEDQQLGGIIMKLLQEFVNIWALFTVFMQWYKKERAQEDDPTFDHAASGRLNNV